MPRKDELMRRAQEYAQRNRLGLVKEFGFGVHGIVLSAESQINVGTSPFRSAVKVHEREAYYLRERDIYLHLKERGIREIRGCAVPELIEYDNDLWIIEMSVVTPPYVLDFAGAYLDWKPDFSEEVMADWRADKQEQFGKHWPEVLAILAFLESHGIYMEDVSPSNISLGP
jgi:hypothetical protein